MTLAAPTTSNPAAARYGDDTFKLASSTAVIEHQLRHRSVRAFSDEPVSEDELSAIIAAASSASTSSNLQAWSVIAVADQERKARLATLAGNQSFIDQAPLFLVWIADLDRHHRLADQHQRPLDGTAYLEATLLAVIDAALAAQNAVIALESLDLGSVFVGAVRNHPDEIARELDLPDHSVAVFGLAIGHPDAGENASVKPRLPQSSVLHRETYNAETADADITRYDSRLSAYNKRYGLAGAWTERVVSRLAGAKSLVGRDRLREIFERRGLPSR